MKVAIGADHHGLDLKKDLIAFLQDHGHEVMDLGAHALDLNDDYPDISAPVAQAVRDGKAERGILVCGSGVGACVAANKFHGVRAAVCHDTYSAAQGVQHDDMNVLCLGSRIVGPALAYELVKAFVGAELDPHPRFKRRLDKVSAIEKRESTG